MIKNTVTKKPVVHSQQGFNLLPLIFVVAGICLIGSGAWWLWSDKQQSQTSNQTQEANKPTVPPAKYLEISELGIKIKLSAGLEDLVYNYDKEYNSKYPEQLRVDLSTVKLTELSNNTCSVDSNASPIGAIVKTKTLPNDNYAPDGKKSFKIGEDYVYWVSPQAPCSTDANVEQAAQNARTEFLEAFKTVQAISVN